MSDRGDGEEREIGHFERFEHTIKMTNEMTLGAAKVVLSTWKKGAASQKDGLFNEAIEKLGGAVALLCQLHALFFSHGRGRLWGVCERAMVYGKKHARNDRLAQV